MQKQSTPCKQAVFTLLLLFGFSSLLSANERIHSSPEKSQLSGAGVGAGLAALALGPVGIIPGAIFGLLTMDNANKGQQLKVMQLEQQQQDNQDSSRLSKQLRSSEQALTKLQQEHDVMLAEKNQINKNRATLAPTHFNISTQLLFRTAESQIETHYHSQLESIAKLLEIMPHLIISIEAHTDEKGATKNNYDLSMARANRVYNFLQNAGVNSKRLTLKAFGETQPVFEESSLENDAYHRRVSIVISSSKQIITAIMK
jgi:flagellar motor protein MotB|tara:strand:+ start:35122 stop:35895 length:774 start_codon:yes stop_codon:yes gene_type:complete